MRGHYRSSPDGNPYNNYSFPGNYNPNTGEVSSGSAESYLRNYYDRTPRPKGSPVWVDGYQREDGTHVEGHWRTAPDGDPTNNYSYPGNYNPNTGEITGGRHLSRTSTRIVQKALHVLGHDPGPIDGIWGEQTKQAIRSFQRAQGLAVDGIPGLMTPSKMREELESRNVQKFDGTRSNRISKEYDQTVHNRPSETPVAPPNASLSSFGSTWTCDRGYRRSGNQCVRQ